MKNVSFSKILMISVLIYSGNIIAQNHSHSHSGHSHHNTNDVITPDDIKNIKGFNEAAAIEELTKNGILGTEQKAALRAKKVQHILAQRGVSNNRTTSFSQRAQRVGPCDNAGFDYANFTNWAGTTGLTNVGIWSPGLVNAGNNSPVSNGASQHTIHTTPGFDPNAINITSGLPEIPYLAPGGSGVSARLGNSDVNYGMEQLKYSFLVTPSNTSFTYQYAVVLEDPSHSVSDQPAFYIKVFDPNGVQVPGNCGIYSVNATNAATDPTFIPFDDPTTTWQTVDGYYKKWTTVSIDLIAFVNNPNPVTIVFETRDCNQGGHYGYAYIDATCSQLQATANFCPNDSILLLSAPGGFSSYQWYDNNGNLIAGPNGTNDTLTVNNPVLGQVYSVNMLSASGCGSSLTVTLGFSNMSLLSGSTNITCYGDNNGQAYVVPSGAVPPFTYNWVDASTGGLVSTNDSLLNASAGTYYVSVYSGGGCSSTDTITITEPSNPGDSLDIDMVFCPGDERITLYAPQGYLGYNWYAGHNSSGPIVGTYDSLVVANPIQGSQFYLEMLNPPPGCPTFILATLDYHAPEILPNFIVETNVFSPNGDGKNDIFDLSQFNYIKEFSVEIYNRWGKRVFISKDAAKQWDGKINGRNADEGVYYWIAKYRSSCVDNAPIVENKGFVQIVR